MVATKMNLALLYSCVLMCALSPASSFLPLGSMGRVGVRVPSIRVYQTSATTSTHATSTRRRDTVRCFFGGGAKKGPPATYDAIASQAIAAVQAGIKAGEKAMEVEFPPLVSLNKINDGSAKNRGLAQANTLTVAKKLVGGLGRGKKVYVVCCEPGARAALGKSLKADIRDMNAKNLPPAKAGDVQVVITPADQSQWKLAKKMAETATVVIVNGVFANGLMPFEPVFYFKPISGWGSVVRQYPDPFTAYLTGSNKVVPCETGLLRQGEVRRPDLRSAANALSAAFKAQEAAR